MDCTTKDTGDSNSYGILLDGALANPSQVQAGRFTLDDLIYRISLVLDENKFIPKIDYLTQVPYWEELHAAAESTIGWDNIIYFLGGADYFGHNEVKFPSPEQMDTIVQIATQQRIINGDDPGAMKTAPSVLEKYFIEQNILEPDEEGNCRLPTLVVVPGDIIPNWVDRIEEYTTEETDPNIVVISSRSKQKALERAMKPDVDYVIVSYTMLHQLAGVDWDSVETKDEVEKRKTELLEQGHSKRTLGDILISHIGPIRGEKKFKKHDDAGLCEQIAKEEIKKESDDVMSVLEQKFISNGPYYVILDEFHHAKNHKAIRTKRLMHICRQADWIVTMSGTKTPDNLNDIGPMAPIMDPKRFRNAKERRILMRCSGIVR